MTDAAVEAGKASHVYSEVEIQRGRVVSVRAARECLSWEHHHTRQAFEEDRRKDRRLKAAGWTVIRVTWHDLDEPGRLAAELAAFF